MSDAVQLPHEVAQARWYLAWCRAAYKADRVGFVQKLRAARLTLSDVGELVGVSRERIRQIEIKARQ